MKTKTFILFTLILLLSVFFSAKTGCSGESSTDNYAEREERLVGINQSNLLRQQPPARITWSLERFQINERTKLWNDRNKISYIYLLNRGMIISFHAIKGKVSSVNSQITNPQKIERFRLSSSDGVALPSPAEDGSYGTNGDAIFFFTQDGVYIEWNGKYFLSDQPMKLTQKPLLIKNVTKKEVKKVVKKEVVKKEIKKDKRLAKPKTIDLKNKKLKIKVK